ncbi:MAG: site-specific DNA-methyltransferase [Patescibacteria group bacterium]|mgnify:CR=1 FL=1
MGDDITKLKKEIERLKKAVKKQKYGLVWMDVPEAFEDDVENKLPILKEVPGLAIKNEDGKPTHILIEGDNYHALTCLNYTHKGKIDVIYIDPPYNTGSDGFKYKDKRILDKFPDGTEVPKDHPFRHSYWLSFMKKRLELSFNLLSKNGIIFISIDDNEVAQLKLLCNEIFGEHNFVEQIIWKNKYGAGAKTRGFISIHEYILCYSRNLITDIQTDLGEGEVKKHNKKDDKYELRGGYRTQPLATKSLGDRPNLVYPIVYKGQEIWPDKQWVWSKERMNFAIANNNVEFTKKDGKYNIRAKQYMKDEKGNLRKGKPLSIIENIFTQEGTNDINEIFGENIFSFPKPKNLIKYLSNLIINGKSNRNSIILDFFAGSGTTGQAIMELNHEDQGNRQFILVTNNDEITNSKKHKIMSDVCYPRIKKVSKIYKSGTKFYRTAFIGKNNIIDTTDEDKIELAHNAGELLAIAENTLELIKQNKYYQLFEDGNKEKNTAVYFREEHDEFEKFIEIVKKLNKETTVYVFSWGDEEKINDFAGMKEIKVKTIPLPILEIYKQIYNLSTQ